jgi:hypothetical protein
MLDYNIRVPITSSISPRFYGCTDRGGRLAHSAKQISNCTQSELVLGRQLQLQVLVESSKAMIVTKFKYNKSLESLSAAHLW